MKIFISWSGDRSKALASALRDLLPDIFEDIEPWMSVADISAGTRWEQILNSKLEECWVGIICLTPENLSSPWLLFEAGALAKGIRESRVIPYVLGLKLTEIPPPLTIFQGVSADRDGTKILVKSLNEIRQSPTQVDRLNRKFSRWWKDLARSINNIPKDVPDDNLNNGGILGNQDIEKKVAMLELRMKAFEKRYASDERLSKPQRADIDNIMSPSKEYLKSILEEIS